MHYYQHDLAFIHGRGYGLHADAAADMLALAPTARARGAAASMSAGLRPVTGSKD